MSREKRRQFSADKKAEMLRSHLGDKVAVSDLSDEYKIQRSPFYTRFTAAAAVTTFATSYTLTAHARCYFICSICN